MRDPKTTAATPATLPEDVVLEILARVPDIADLFRCAAACKRWRVLVADRPFLRRRWPDDARHPSSLLGFFGQEWCRQEVPAPLPDFVRAPRSVLGPGRPFLSSFVPGAASLFDRAAPLASNSGLLLVRYVPRGAPPNDGEQPTVDHLAVCNLLSGTCDVLPPLPCGCFVNYFGTSAYAVLAGGDCSCSTGRPPLQFKVLIMGLSQDGMRYDLRNFSSGEQSWSAPAKCFSLIEHNIFGPILQRSAVVRAGTVHWLIWDMVNFHDLGVDAMTGHVSLHMLPAPQPQDLLVRCQYDQPRLSVADDGTTLSSLCLFREDLTVETSTWLDDDGDADHGHWCRDRVVELRPKEQQIDGPLCMCMGERSGTMLIRAGGPCVYIADLESGALEEVTNQFCGLHEWKTAIPVEIDWPAFFMCRLGGKSVL